MIEKKLILCGIFAIAIAIAAIVPLEYMMAAEAQENAQPITQTTTQPSTEANIQTAFTPWFNVNVSYAYVTLDKSGGNDTMTWKGAVIQAIANFTLTSDALDFKNADAYIEFYLFQVSSDQGSIVNITYNAAVSKEEEGVTGVPGGIRCAIRGSGGNTFTFADGTTYKDAKICGDSDCGGGMVLFNGPRSVFSQTFTSAVGDYISSYNGNPVPQAVTELRNAQTLYIDVSRIGSVSFEGTATTPLTTALAGHQVLQHIVLTKAGNGFVYGNYTRGTVPIPIEGPSNPSGS
jgi:hypothetical protein